MAVTGIAFTVYPAADVDKSVAFYRDVIGLSVATHMPDFYAEFPVGDGWFSVAGPKIATAEPGSAHSLALEVDSIEDEAKRIAATGAVVGAIVETEACFLAHVTDPDGNTMLLHEAKPGSPDAAKL
jgi:predicted enzyme related to lactoylglutathione lyase